MESFFTIVLIIVLTVILFRVLMLPVKLVRKLLLHSGCGLVCLWLVNLTAGFTGLMIPINALTALIAGALGIPGILLLAVLQLML